ncbi:MAG: alpha/beta hydrolase [Candidatus Rokubacteria bacterium 13_1_40CM_69_27]|nr:MAG: alpha/beta hydrolase [Candidatus Rokubacteria bacterium 13_1_40CM_69_27]OLC30046.1 MAG: alpha/beta hydrolase [Candidatus Rokubacteria bacterium 13_1_40CM_4_69_5]
MEERVSFSSDGLKLSGVLQTPGGRGPRERQPAWLVLHGFGSNKDGGVSLVVARMLADLGYVTLRFDFRGCGESEGPRGRVICLEQVEDTKNALSFLATRPEVDPQRIALIGNSFGAAVAVYTAGVDPRVAACISTGGWGDGEKKFRKQHESPEAWKTFTAMVEKGRRQRERTGQSIMVPRYDIVPIPPALRSNLSPGSIMEFPFEVVESMYAFKANEVVGKIAPRPLLLLHPSHDSVTPTEQSIDLFRHAGQPTELHLVANVDHFMLGEGNPLVIDLVRHWLEKYVPLSAGPR